MMNTNIFPHSPRLGHLAAHKRASLLATCYAFYAYSHNKHLFIDTSTEVVAHVLGSFPVWHATDERPDFPIPYSFTRHIGDARYVFHRTQTEFTAIQFCSKDGRKVAHDAAVFAHLNYDDHETHLLSTFNVSVELLTRMSLALETPGAFPRILMVQGTGQAGLMLTTNHQNHRDRREHLVWPLPDLSLGKAVEADDQFGNTKLSLKDFVLSCNYPMRISSGRSDKI